MDTKLTIRVPEDLLEGAKRYARENNTTLTRLVSEYLRHLTQETDPLKHTPAVERLSGVVADDVSIQDYRDYLDKKYGG